MLFWRIPRIKYRLLIIFLILTLVILTLVMFTSYRNTIDIIEEQTVSTNQKLIQIGINRLEEDLREIEDLFQSLYISSMFNDYVKNSIEENDYTNIRAYEYMRNILQSLMTQREDIFSICYIDKKGNLSYVTKKEAGSIAKYAFTKEYEWFSHIYDYNLENKNETVYLTTYKHIPIKFTVTDMDKNIFSVSRCIVNVIGNYEPVGVLFINVELSGQKAILQEINPFTDSKSYILGPDGEIVFASTDFVLGEIVPEEIIKNLNSNNGNFIYFDEGEKYIGIYAASELNGWTLLNLVSFSEYSTNIARTARIFGVIGLIALAITAIIIFFVSGKISRPVEELSLAMKEVKTGNMEIRFKTTGYDEIGRLGDSFNSLMETLNHVIKVQFETQIRQKDAQLKALHAQINPHFLYNILQSISSLADINNITEISEMSGHLANMLRYSIKTEGNTVSFLEECNHARWYLELQKIRYRENLEYKISIPKYLENYEILKLTIQPLVENCLIHGFDGIEYKGIVFISISKEFEKIIIDISDNGIGISEENLKEIRSEIKEDTSGFYSESSEGLGLKNVFTRFRLFYGNNIVMEIESEKSIGTTVRLVIPAVMIGDK